MKRSAFKNRGSGLKRTGKLNPLGPKGKANLAANKVTKARVESEGLEFCWLCGSTFNLQRSHSEKRRELPDLLHIAILDGECHNWLEYMLDPITREKANDLLIEMRFDDGHERFSELCRILSDGQRRSLESMLVRRQRHTEGAA